MKAVLFGFWYYVALKCNAWRESRPVSPKQGLENSQKCWEGGLIVSHFCQMKELKHKVVLVVLPVSWTVPGLSWSCLPPWTCSFIFTVRAHHSAIQPKEARFYTKPKKMKIRAEKQNKWEEAPAELRRRILCFLIRQMAGTSRFNSHLNPQTWKVRNLRPSTNPGTKDGDVAYEVS